MWVRKRIDIGWGGIGYGLLRCLLPGNAAKYERRIASQLPRPEEAVTCFSVRSGFDLLLAALKLPAGSEVLLSAMTLGHMADIVREHGLVPVPVDLDPETMAPDLDALERGIRPETRVLVVAHLFGGRCRMERLVEICRERNIFLIEDMAQAFGSGRRWGGGQSDVAMFSFGTIKTATAGGGAVLRVRDAELANRMRVAQAGWPQQSLPAFAVKLGRIACLKFLGYRIPYGLFRRFCAALRIDADLVLSRGTRAFPGADLMAMIRRQPHPALLALLCHRLNRFDTRYLRRRAMIGRMLRDALAGVVDMPGQYALAQTHWVFPLCLEKSNGVISKLAAEGFDATARQSMEVIRAPAGIIENKPMRVSEIFAGMVYLPAYPEMGEAEILRMARILSDHFAPTSGK
jgi:dTDP-4-amino-4,6-dideoxygalactose transaminase